MTAFLQSEYQRGASKAWLTMPTAADEEGLARAFARGDRRAFEESYARYGKLLYSTAYTVLRERDDAQDCVHDALLRMWRSRSYSTTRGTLRSFLTVCVRNEAISRRRSKARRLRLEQRLATEPEEFDEVRIADPVEHDRLRAAFSRLPEDQRVALELAYYEGKTHSEIAAQLDEPLGTVKSRISLGLRKLASALQSSPKQIGEKTP